MLNIQPNYSLSQNSLAFKANGHNRLQTFCNVIKNPFNFKNRSKNVSDRKLSDSITGKLEQYNSLLESLTYEQSRKLQEEISAYETKTPFSGDLRDLPNIYDKLIKMAKNVKGIK